MCSHVAGGGANDGLVSRLNMFMSTGGRFIGHEGYSIVSRERVWGIIVGSIILYCVGWQMSGQRRDLRFPQHINI
eukprot:473933-Pyramimonas_sp.AAC.1